MGTVPRRPFIGGGSACSNTNACYISLQKVGAVPLLTSRTSLGAEVKSRTSIS